MAKCVHCNVEILDSTDVCPLCNSVLEPGDPMENMYPDAVHRLRKLVILSRIYLFCAILIEALLFAINIYLQSEVWWSGITGLCFLLGHIIIKYTILGDSPYQSKIITLGVVGVTVSILIDLLIGYRGWSVDYVLPAGILLMDGIIILCMIINRHRWQNYIMWQILMVSLSCIPLGLFLMGLGKNVILVSIPLAISLALFIGTVIIGERTAMTELKRRFHIW